MFDATKQEILHKQINDMSASLLTTDQIKGVYQTLSSSVYNDLAFRHRYSDFFSWLMELVGTDVNDEKIAILAENLNNLLKTAQDEYSSSSTSTQQQKRKAATLIRNIEKLCDHMNLEIARFQKNTVLERQLEQAKTEAHASTTALKESRASIADAARKLSKAERKASSLQGEIISVLSIFSAIVIATSGGFSFISASISSLSSGIPFHRVLCVISLCGIALFNSVFVLLYMVGKIIDRSVYTACSASTNADKSEACHTCTAKCCSLTKIRKRLPYIFWFNITMILFLVIVGLRWLYLNKYWPF